MNPYETITGVDAKGETFTLPPLAVQWKEDMTRRVEVARRTNPDAYPVLRAPQSFIDTGRWPADTPRPASN